MEIRTLFFALLQVSLNPASISAKDIRLALSKQTRLRLYQLAKKQDMSHLVGYGLQLLGLPIDIEGTNFENDMFMALIRRENINYEMQRFDSLMANLALPYIPLKGASIAEYYPETWMRTSCDIDILVHPEHMEAIGTALVDRLGYKRTGETTHDVSYYSENNVHLELHFALFDDDNVNSYYEDIWKIAKFESGAQRGTLPLAYETYVHIGHIAKHFECGGFGVRPIIDLALMRRLPDYSDEETFRLCQQAYLSEFYLSLKDLSDVWLNAHPHSAKTQTLENFIFSGGIYGSVERHIALELRTKSRVRFLWERLFAPREYLCTVYPNLKKHPNLLWWYQVRRLFRLLDKTTAKRISKEVVWSKGSNASVEITKLAEIFNVFNHGKKR